MAAYCTTDDLKAVTAQLDFDTTTRPTLAQVTAMVDNIARELDMACLALGWTLPVTDATMLGFLKVVNVYGAAGAVFRARLDFQGGDAWEKKYLGVKRLLPPYERVADIDSEPFGDGFPAPDPDADEDPDQPWADRETEY